MPRSKTPTDKLVKTGNYRPSRHGNRDAPGADPSQFPMDPPAWLHPLAKQEWQRIVPLLCERGALQPEDAGLLEVYVSLFAQIRAGLADGRLVPAAVLTSLGQLAGRLGLSPADRGKVTTTPKRDTGPAKNKWQRLLEAHGKTPRGGNDGGDAA